MRLNSRIGIVVALIVMGTPGLASAIVIRADRSDSQYLDLAKSSAYASVGRFDGATSAFGFIASGTLIAPDWVLTAGHVVDQATSLNFSIGGSTYAANQMVANPSWNGDLLAGYDIALVHLSKSVPGITPAKRYTGNMERGVTTTMVGYGMTGNGLTGSTGLDGNKRAAQNVIDQYQNSRLMLADFDNPKNRSDSSMGSSTALTLEGMIAPGDSGGGMFITSGKNTYLAGVTSFAGAFDGQVNSDYGDLGGFTRVSAFNAWIDSVMSSYTAAMSSTVAQNATGSVMATMSPVPEPSSLVLLLSGALALFAWRRRRAK